ncbi:MAG TPA: 3-oxoadipate--succinyl-CoA transferase subunit B, partial [Rhodospirillaceae bacterium]|nr:3-oxoadipate--succinyl-CoA transferase subunit B [Rhodospirillaceae bacterium]
VDKIDFYTSFGHGEGGDHRKRLGITTQGPMLLVTDLAVWEPDPISKEFTVTSLHPGVTRDAVQATVGWTVAFADSVTETPPPTTEELDVLRALHARTDAAHGKKEKAA